MPRVHRLCEVSTDMPRSAQETDGTYLQNSLSLTVMTNTTLAAHKAVGGSPMGVEDAGAYLWVRTLMICQRPYL